MEALNSGLQDSKKFNIKCEIERMEVKYTFDFSSF